MASREEQTSARDGWITFALSLALWGGLLGAFLYVGHQLALHMVH